jgi:hypothetical protein
MNKLYLVQQYPYEDWETITHFNNEADAVALCNQLSHQHSLLEVKYNNYRVKSIYNNPINRNFFNVQ